MSSSSWTHLLLDSRVLGWSYLILGYSLPRRWSILSLSSVMMFLREHVVLK